MSVFQNKPLVSFIQLQICLYYKSIEWFFSLLFIQLFQSINQSINHPDDTSVDVTCFRRQQEPPKMQVLRRHGRRGGNVRKRGPWCCCQGARSLGLHHPRLDRPRIRRQSLRGNVPILVLAARLTSGLAATCPVHGIQCIAGAEEDVLFAPRSQRLVVR